MSSLHDNRGSVPGKHRADSRQGDALVRVIGRFRSALAQGVSRGLRTGPQATADATLELGGGQG
ncbi:MAG TPA: hypothetical protein VF049_21235 [Nocardioidaceae bacterium]|jgi:hypothetical protein